jgi:hypothetical protein
MQRYRRFWIMVATGILLVAAGVVDICRLAILRPEKEAYYLFGHWFDAFWEIHLPALVSGLVLIILGVRLSRQDAVVNRVKSGKKK